MKKHQGRVSWMLAVGFLAVLIGWVLINPPGCASNNQSAGPFQVFVPLVTQQQAEVPVPTAPPDPTSTPRPDTPPDDGSWADVKTWVYQLSGLPQGRLDQIAASDFDLAVVDLSRDGSTDYFTAAEIAAVQATGKIVLAYFEVGAIEDYRPEWSSVPADVKLGSVSGWPNERYVRYWDSRWWPVVQGRIDQALAAGFDGAYLDMIVTYEEIPANTAGTNRDDLARKMVALIAQITAYAKQRDPAFKVVPQNSPELYRYAGYLDAIAGLGMEELYIQATDVPCTASWCAENRDAAAAVAAAGKLVLTIDYANQQANIDSAYRQSRAAGFVPYVSVRDLDIMREE